MSLNKTRFTLITVSAALVRGYLTFVFILERLVAVSFLVLDDAIVAIRATELKLEYIMRMKAPTRLNR